MSNGTELKQFVSSASYLRVADIAKSVHYYKDVLGFHVDMFDAGFALVSRDHVTIMFQQPPTGQSMEHKSLAAYIWVPDIDDYHRKFEAKGVKVTNLTSNDKWGTREFEVEDPDGHQLRFGQIVFAQAAC